MHILTLFNPAPPSFPASMIRGTYTNRCTDEIPEQHAPAAQEDDSAPKRAAPIVSKPRALPFSIERVSTKRILAVMRHMDGDEHRSADDISSFHPRTMKNVFVILNALYVERLAEFITHPIPHTGGRMRLWRLTRAGIELRESFEGEYA